MIKINERISIDRDISCWMVRHEVPGKTKSGEPTTNTQRRYYPTIESALMSVADEQLVGVGSISEIIDRLISLKNDILDASKRLSATIDNKAMVE